MDAIGGIFDQLLAHMADAPPLPISANRQTFLDYVTKNDLTCLPPFYSAYPDLKVLDILTLQKQHGESQAASAGRTRRPEVRATPASVRTRPR